VSGGLLSVYIQYSDESYVHSKFVFTLLKHRVKTVFTKVCPW